jgi:FKBP-type peptidyl-prolyl cis-trans isomerase FkpA
MRITTVLFGLLLLLCVACDKSEKETPSGLKFKIVKAGDGVLPEPKQIVLFNYVFKDSKDSTWADTFKEEFPQAMQIADSMAIATEGGLIQMFRFLSKGDSATTSMPIKTFFSEVARAPIPYGIDTTLTLSFSFKIKDILSEEGFMAFQNEWLEKRNAEQLVKDTNIIDSFLSEKGIVAEKTESGLRYIITKPGKGENGKSGQTAKVNYTGYLIDGTYFDSSIKAVAEEKGLYNPMREPYSPYDVTIDQTGVIKGWHEALKLMNKGAKATFYIPSTLAYGPQQRSEVIKANSILVFEMEVVDVK